MVKVTNAYKEKIVYVVGNRIFELLARISIIFTVYLTVSTFVEDPYLLTAFQVMGGALVIWMTYHYTTTSFGLFRNDRQARTRYHRQFLNKQVYIGYEVGSFWDVVDRFKEEEEVAVVLGVNNRFCLDEDYLSRTSLISDYMKNVPEGVKKNLHERIESEMGRHIISCDRDNRPIYAFGSLYVMQDIEELHYEAALLSMCEPSSSNLAGRFTSTRETLIESFEKLFEQMPSVFTSSTLIIPLIGTKSSGSPLSQEEVAKFLISAFANYSRVNQHRMAKRLIISLYDKDFKEMEDLMKIKKHIDMEVERGDFSYSKLKSEIA